MSPGTWELAAHHTEPWSCRQRRRRARRAERLPRMGPRREGANTGTPHQGWGPASGVSHPSGKCSNARNLSLVGSHSTSSITSNKIKRFLTQKSLPLPTRSPPEPFPKQAHTAVGRWAAPLRAPHTPPDTKPAPSASPLPTARPAGWGTFGITAPHRGARTSPCQDPKKVTFLPFTVQEEDLSHTFPPRSRRAGAGARRHLGSG